MKAVAVGPWRAGRYSVLIEYEEGPNPRSAGVWASRGNSRADRLEAVALADQLNSAFAEAERIAEEARS